MTNPDMSGRYKWATAKPQECCFSCHSLVSNILLLELFSVSKPDQAEGRDQLKQWEWQNQYSYGRKFGHTIMLGLLAV